MTLKIAQVNLGRCVEAAAEIRDWAVDEGIDVLLIQEPYTLNDMVKGFGLGACVIQADSETPYAAVITLKRELDVVKVSDLTTGHTATAVIRCFGVEIIVVSAYCRGGWAMEDCLVTIRQAAVRYGDKHLVVGADANARAEEWFSGESDRRGEELQDLLIETDLQVCNLPSRFKTFRGHQGEESNIDVTLATRSMHAKLASWVVSDQHVFPDHRTISVAFDLEDQGEVGAEGKTEKTGRFKTRGVDWEEFRDKLGGKWVNKREVARGYCRLEDRVYRLEQVLTETCEEVCGRTRPATVRKNKWWTPALDKARREAKKCRERFRKEREPQMREEKEVEWRREKRKLKNAIRKAKKHSWREFVSSVGARDPWSIIYKLQSGKLAPREPINTVQLGDGVTSDFGDTYTALCSKMFPPDSREGETPEHTKLRQDVDLNSDGQDECGVGEEEVRSCLSEMVNNRAPGHDGIEVRVLKESWGVLSTEITGIIRECLVSGQFPKRYKIGKLVILQKPGKPPGEVGSYRPITLLSVMGKLVEKVIARRLRAWMLRVGITGERQFGFVSGRSTSTAMQELQRVVSSSNAETVWGVFIDISGAFDNAWPPLLLDILRKNGCPGNIYRLMRDYLTGRSVIAHTGRVWRVQKGCPQGSVLGPLVWTIILSEWLNKDHGPNTWVVGYADDVAIAVEADSKRSAQVRVQTIVDDLARWARRAKLEISPSKTVLVCLRENPVRKKGRPVKSHWRRGEAKINWQPSIKVGGGTLPVTDSVKYLGSEIGRGFSLTGEVKARAEKAKKVMAPLRRVNNVTWGVGFNVMMTMYAALFLPIILYGVGLWGDFALRNKKDRVSKLRAAQRFALAATCNAYRTVSWKALVAACGVLPIDKVVQVRATLEKEAFQWYREGVSIGERRARSWKRRQELESGAWVEWQREWETVEISASGRDIGARTKVLIPSVKEWADRRKNRCLDQYTVGYLTGHLGVGEYLHRVGATTEQHCECGAVETVDHCLWDCDLHLERREALRSELGLGQDERGDVTNWSHLKAIGRALKGLLEDRKERLAGVALD